MKIRIRIETLALSVGRMFDFSGRLNFQRHYYLSVASDKIDYDALASDWDVVGGGLADLAVGSSQNLAEHGRRGVLKSHKTEFEKEDQDQ